MSKEDFSVDGPLGANFNRRTKEREYQLGCTARGTKNTAWIYVKATADCTADCTVNPTTFALTNAAGKVVADTDFKTGEHGWVRDKTADVAA